MKLISIELNGFKSFCDKTVIQFNQQKIISIIGPNGCGKSNIVDAIRWVLGEQSSKMLRGSSMQDVIFSGSESRAPLSFCEVSLNFENDLENLPKNYNQFKEIHILRKLYSNGESDYQINQVSCRLLDIKELLLSSGSSSRGYSIIEQNKISNIITSRPENLREIIDEAASILVYKIKRKDSEKKITTAQQNLVRIIDRLDIIENQSKDIKEQAELLDVYEVLKEKINHNTKCIDSIKWLQFNDEYKVIFEKKDKNNQEILSLESQNNVFELHTQKKRLQLEQLTSQVKNQWKKINGLEKEISEIETNIKLDSLSLKHLHIQVATLQQNQLESKKKINTIKGDKEKNTEIQQQLENKIKRIQTESTQYQNETFSLNQNISQIEKSLEEINHQKAEYSLSKLKAESKIEQNTQILKQYLAQSDYKNQLEQIKIILEQLHNQAINTQQEIDKNAELTKDIEAKKSNIQFAIEEKKQKSKALHHSVLQLQSSLKEKNKESHDLEQVIKNQNYLYDKDTKKFHQYLKENPLIAKELGFQGTLVSYLNLQGAHLQLKKYFFKQFQNTLVFDQIQKIEAIKEKLNEFQLSKIEIYFTHQLHHQSADEFQFFPLENIQTITSVAQEYFEQHSNKIFAHENNYFITPYQTIVFFENIENEKIFEIQKLKEDYQLLETSIEFETNQVKKIEEEKLVLEDLQNNHAEQIQYYQKERQTIQIETVKKTKELEYTNTTIQEKIKEQQQLENKIKQSTEDAEGLETENATLLDVITQSTVKLVDLENQKEIFQLKYEEQKKNLRQLTNKHQKLNIDSTRTEEQLYSQQKEKKKLDQEYQELINSSDTDTSIDNDDQIKTTEKKIQIYQQERQRKIEQKESELKELRQIEKNQHQQQFELDEEVNKTKQTQTKQQSIQQQAFQINIELDRLDNKIKNIEQNLLSQFQIIPSEFINTFEYKEYDTKAKSKSLEQWHSELNQMPQVNFAAKEAYHKIKTEIDFLTEQKDDLSQSIDAIQKSIQKINIEIEQIFSQTFKDINIKLNEIFPLIFNGGSAQLSLTDEENILESGVDIEVKLPGKKINNLSLMSGGEKAMTALAFLFAMFLTKPSPFCILDEVDAPLDDANTNKFCNLIKKLAQHTQFIIITHSKTTIEASQQLFGVTMQEAGVSKIVSVNLDTILQEQETTTTEVDTTS